MALNIGIRAIFPSQRSDATAHNMVINAVVINAVTKSDEHRSEEGAEDNLNEFLNAMILFNGLNGARKATYICLLNTCHHLVRQYKEQRFFNKINGMFCNDS